MTNKFHILLIILTIGFFATPTLTYACGTNTNNTEKSCCKKDKSNKTEKKDCCKNHKSKNDGDCGGNCKHPSCSCPVVHYAFNLPFSTELKTKPFFAESKKLKFYDKETYLSSGFYSIWTPPNIG